MARALLASLVVFACIFASPACRNSSGTSAAEQPAAQQPASRAPIKPVLAKARLADARTAATEWKPDAVLIQVAGRTTGDDGLSHWNYGFYSKTAKTCLVVTIAATTLKRESGGAMCESAELTDFMDSDQAIRTARKNGITAQSVTMMASMSAMAKPSRPLWAVYDNAGTKSGDVMLDLDARTGAVVSKIVQK